jgi:Domain of unknown function (DUF3870)
MNTHIFSGHGQLPEGTNLSVIHKYATVVVKIDMDSSTILDCEIPILCGFHNEFISEIVCGRSIVTDLASIIDEINDRVHSLSTKALIISLQVILNRYMMVKKKLEEQVK